MLLVFDVGNTHTVVGLFSSNELVADWRIASDKAKTEDEYGVLLKSFFKEANIEVDRVKDALISSVVPPITGIIERMIERYFLVKPLIVGPGIKTGLSIKYESPREIGADRVVNAVAAINLYNPPLIIVDFGTATTFCAIAENGDYLGGAIAPGIGIASEALFQRTAKLPRVELIKPKSVIGKNTINSIQSGLIFGYIGLVEGIIMRMKAEIGGSPLVVATGGFAQFIAENAKMIDEVNPNLTLMGLRMIHELNK